MFELLSPIFFISVVSCVGGASISQAGSSSFPNEQHIVKSHTISDLATNLWKDMHSSMNMVWEKIKLFARMTDRPTNKTVRDGMGQDSYPTQVTETTTALPQLKVLSVDFTNNKSTVNNQTDPLLITNSTDEENSNICEELTCMTWRILKIVGVAVGVGFIVSLFSPVLFYFIILNIGYLCYAIAFISMALSCKADKGSQLGEKLFTACQEIGGNSLQNMFSPFPIFLTWLGSGCLIGWFVWPYF